MRLCKHCGARVPYAAVICTRCGCQVGELDITEAGDDGETAYKNRRTALLLCLFLGIFGAHKFYEGKIGMGVLYLLTLGLFIIGAVVDFITILKKPDTYRA